jgi:hypothetical protein
MAATGTGTTSWTKTDLEKWSAGTEEGYIEQTGTILPFRKMHLSITLT